MSNGCGLFGGISKLWKIFTEKYPPFESCCDEHDLAYEQISNEAEREWADKQFKRCMKRNGYPITGNIFFVAVRAFGWLSRVKQRIFKKG